MAKLGLDDLDDRIIRLLEDNGRRSNTEIARELGVSESTVRQRIVRLLDEDWINIVAVPGTFEINRKYTSTMRVSVEPAALHGAAQQICDYPEIRYVAISDRLDILVEAYFRDREHMLDFVTTTLANVPGVTRIGSASVLKVLKYSHAWRDAEDQSDERVANLRPAAADTRG